MPSSEGIHDRLLSKYTLAFALFAWVVFLHIAGLSLFTRGFLLTRLALSSKSTCSPGSECTLPPTHRRAIILIIDALRFDFLAPLDAVPSPPSPYYHNVLTLPRELSAAERGHSFLFNAHSDPPTATLQRIKGITTGSLPTFVDIGASFSASTIEEDSFVAQLKAAGKKIAFAGDDTWLTAFSNPFERNMSFPYDSFNVEDLHSVDDGVIRHLFPLLDINNEAISSGSEPVWDVFIGHFLGVDHVGHRLGPAHPTMRAKLLQMDNVLRQLVASLHDDTLLIVLGDHGMDAKGDHGGDGLLETSSALWIYSKGVPLAHPNPNIMDHDLITSTIFPGSSAAHRSVHQIDLVPTLSLLLGLPIPFNNLGTVIPELFTYRPNHRRSSHSSLPLRDAAPSPSGRTSWWGTSSNGTASTPNCDSVGASLHTLRTATRYNAEQIMAYLQTYRVSSSGAELDASWESLRRAFNQSVNAVDGISDTDAIEKHVAFTRLSLEVCRNLWAQFNAPRMMAGLVLLGGSLLTVSIVYLDLAHHRMDWERVARETGLRGWYGVITGAIGSAAGLALGILKSSWTVSLETGDIVLASAAFVSQILVLTSIIPTLLRTVRTSHTSQTHGAPGAHTSLPILLLVLHAMSFASNSFILWEDRLVPFFLVTILVSTILSSLSAPSLHMRVTVYSLIISGAVRLISISTVCREEQHPYCSVTFYASATRPLTPLPVVLAVLPLGLGLPWVVRWAFLARSMSDKGPARFALETIWRVALLGGSTYWIIEWCESVFGDIGSPDGKHSTAHTGWLVASLAGRTVLARIVLGGTLVGAYVFWWNSPLNIEIRVEDSAPSSGKKRTVTVLGFANAYGSAYLLFTLPFFAVLWTATQLSGQVVFALGLGAVLCYVEVVDSQRDARAIATSFASASSPDAALDAVAEADYDPSAVQHARSPTLAEPVFLSLLGHLLFFGSGHQAVLSSIQWKTAFVGFPALTYPWSPALVSLNTFGPFILPALCLPLFATWAVPPVQPAQVGKAKTLVLADAVRLTLGMQLYYTALLLGTATSAAILRRHLMVWKVFAPRFMLAGVTVLAVDAALALGLFVGLARVNKKVVGVFGRQM